MKPNDELVNGKPILRCTTWERDAAVLNSNRSIGYLTKPDSVMVFSFTEMISISRSKQTSLPSTA